MQNRLAAVLVMCSVFLSSIPVRAETEQKSDFSLGAVLSSDTFFGFAPILNGAYKMSDSTSLTFYGIFWSAGQPGGSWGNWTEFGVGVSKNFGNGLVITPQFGILGGSLLSSSAGGKSVFADGVVPNLTINYDQSDFYGEIYAGYYLPTRDTTNGVESTLAYIHYWGMGLYKFSNFFSAGAHYEHLINSGGSKVTNSSGVYQWVGPSVQFSKPTGGMFVRMSGGWDTVAQGDSFFKLVSGINF